MLKLRNIISSIFKGNKWYEYFGALLYTTRDTDTFKYIPTADDIAIDDTYLVVDDGSSPYYTLQDITMQAIADGEWEAGSPYKLYKFLYDRDMYIGFEGCMVSDDKKNWMKVCKPKYGVLYVRCYIGQVPNKLLTEIPQSRIYDINKSNELLERELKDSDNKTATFASYDNKASWCLFADELKRNNINWRVLYKYDFSQMPFPIQIIDYINESAGSFGRNVFVYYSEFRIRENYKFVISYNGVELTFDVYGADNETFSIKSTDDATQAELDFESDFNNGLIDIDDISGCLCYVVNERFEQRNGEMPILIVSDDDYALTDKLVKKEFPLRCGCKATYMNVDVSDVMHVAMTGKNISKVCAYNVFYEPFKWTEIDINDSVTLNKFIDDTKNLSAYNRRLAMNESALADTRYFYENGRGIGYVIWYQNYSISVGGDRKYKLDVVKLTPYNYDELNAKYKHYFRVGNDIYYYGLYYKDTMTYEYVWHRYCRSEWDVRSKSRVTVNDIESIECDISNFTTNTNWEYNFVIDGNSYAPTIPQYYNETDLSISTDHASFSVEIIGDEGVGHNYLEYKIVGTNLNNNDIADKTKVKVTISRIDNSDTDNDYSTYFYVVIKNTARSQPKQIVIGGSNDRLVTANGNVIVSL